MDRKLKKRIRELKREMTATKEESREVSVGQRTVDDPYGNVNYNQGVCDTIKVIEYKTIVEHVPDGERRSKAISELFGIYRSLGHTDAESFILTHNGRLAYILYKIETYGDATNNNLETAIAHAGDWRSDLHSTILVKEGKTHLEDDYSEADGLSGHDRQTGLKQVEVVDEPTITKPDTLKVEGARANLTKMFESSEWYSARYYAGDILDRQVMPFESWISDLEKKLWAVKTIEGSSRQFSNRQWGDRDSGGYAAWSEEEKEADEEVPDHDTRLKAVQDAAKLYSLFVGGAYPPINSSWTTIVENLLKKAYQDNTHQIRAIAGRSLLYSKARVFLHNLFG